MIFYFYPGLFLSGNNIIIDQILFFKPLYNTPTLEFPNLGSITTYNACNDTTYSKNYLDNLLFLEFKQVETFGCGIHQCYLLIIWLT